jgi:hypothetical protein
LSLGVRQHHLLPQGLLQLFLLGVVLVVAVLLPLEDCVEFFLFFFNVVPELVDADLLLLDLVPLQLLLLDQGGHHFAVLLLHVLLLALDHV